MSRIAALTLVFSLLTFSTSYAANATTYTISPASYPDLCIAPSESSEGSKLIVTSCDTSSDIVWTMNGASLQNTATDMCADVTDGGAWSGNVMQVWGCFSNNHHQMFTSSTGNQGAVKWSGQNLCFDLTDGKGVDGTHVQIWECAGANPNQQWIFTEAEEVDDDCGGSGLNSLTTHADTPQILLQPRPLLQVPLLLPPIPPQRPPPVLEGNLSLEKAAVNTKTTITRLRPLVGLPPKPLPIHGTLLLLPPLPRPPKPLHPLLATCKSPEQPSLTLAVTRSY
jgi:hypothetical protein